LATGPELIQEIVGRHHLANRSENKTIFDEFIKVKGLHHGSVTSRI